MNQNMNPTDTNSENDPALSAAVWAVNSDPIDQDAVARVKERAKQLAVGGPSAKEMDGVPCSEPLKRSSPSFWRPGTFLKVLAASLLIAVAVFAFIQPQQSAFAIAIHQLREAKAFSFTELIFTTQQEEPIESRTFVAPDGRSRTEVAGMVNILDPYARVRISLIELTKTAIVYPEDEEAEYVHDVKGWYEALTTGSDVPDERLGTKILEGRNAEGFVIRHGHIEFKVWVDSKSHRLLQVEYVTQLEGSGILKSVAKDFRFDEEFDESQFSYEVPEGYDVFVDKQGNPDTDLTDADIANHDPEQNIIDLLKGFTDLNDGKFPKSITNWSEWLDTISKSRTLADNLGIALVFVAAMDPDDYEYVGEGMTTSDERQIVFWYRVDDKTRAIFNDFTVEDASGELPTAKPPAK